MTQRELDRAVARATRETVTEIRRRGFGLLKAGAMPPEGRRPAPEQTPLGPRRAGIIRLSPQCHPETACRR